MFIPIHRRRNLIRSHSFSSAVQLGTPVMGESAIYFVSPAVQWTIRC